MSLSLDDVKGSIRKGVSYWAIDESGNPSRKKTEDGKAYTISAVTELSKIDYERLLHDVPLHDGEVHFNHLYHGYPEICIRLMTDLGEQNMLIVSLTVHKRSKTVQRIKGIPRDELYLYALLKELIDAILMIDLSDSIVITFDRNDQLRDDSCYLLWSDRCMVIMEDSKAYRLLQMADLSASSIGKSELPAGFSDDRFFKRIEKKTVRLEEGLDGCTQQPSSAPPRYKRICGYIKDSIRAEIFRKKEGRL